MHKFNWKSLIPLAVVLLSPIISPQLAKVGVQVAPAFALPFLMVFPLAYGGAVLPIIQAFGSLIAGVTAHGAFSLGAADWKTNLAGVAASFFALASSFGLHVSPDVQVAVGGLGAALILLFSAHPEQNIGA